MVPVITSGAHNVTPTMCNLICSPTWQWGVASLSKHRVQGVCRVLICRFFSIFPIMATTTTTTNFKPRRGKPRTDRHATKTSVGGAIPSPHEHAGRGRGNVSQSRGKRSRNTTSKQLVNGGMANALAALLGEADAAREFRREEREGRDGGQQLPECIDVCGKKLTSPHHTHRHEPYLISESMEKLLRGVDPRPSCYANAQALDPCIDMVGVFLTIMNTRRRNKMPIDGRVAWLWGEPGVIPNTLCLHPGVNEATVGRGEFLHRRQVNNVCLCPLGGCGCGPFNVAIVGPHVMRMSEEQFSTWICNMRAQGVVDFYVVVPLVTTQKGSVLKEVAWEWVPNRADGPALRVDFMDTGFYETVQVPLELIYTSSGTQDADGLRYFYAKVDQTGPYRVISVQALNPRNVGVLDRVGPLDYRKAVVDTALIGPLMPNPVSLGVATTNPRSSGTVAYRPVPIWSLQDHLLVRVERLGVIAGPVIHEEKWVPKQLIQHLSKLTIGKSRDVKLYNELSNETRRWARTSDVDMQEGNISAAVPLAMSYFLDDDAASARSCQHIFTSSQNMAIGTLLSGTEASNVRALGLVGAILFGAYLTYRMRSIDLRRMQAGSILSSLGWVWPTACFGVGKLASWLSPFFSRCYQGAKAWLSRPVTYSNPRSVDAQLALAVLKVAIPWYEHIQHLKKRTVVHKRCPGIKEKPTLGPDNGVDLTNVVTTTCYEQPFAGEIVGFMLSDIHPVYPTSCAHSEALALMERQLKEQTVDPGHRDIWADAVQFVEVFFGPRIATINLHRFCGKVNHPTHPSWLGRVFPQVAELQPTCFNDWLMNFPEKKQIELRVARELKGPIIKNDAQLKCFVKFEASPKFIVGLGGAEHIPRNISPREPLYQVRTGPWTHAVSKYVATTLHQNLMDDSIFAVVYTSGMTADQLGEAFECALRRAGQHVVIVENDFSRFDGSISPELVALELALHASFGCPDEVFQAMAWQLRCDGTSGKGVKFWGVGTRKSGDGNTSVGNSLLNAIVHFGPLTDNLCPISFDLDRSSMFVLGDDNVLILSGLTHVSKGETRSFAAYVEDEQRKLGLRPKIKIVGDRWDTEFCSGLFYPAIRGSKEIVVWGPKIGRVLYKTGIVKADGHNLKGPYLAKSEYRGTLIGLLATVSHVPILGSLFSNHLSQLNAMGIKRADMPKKMEHQILTTTPSKIHPLTYSILSRRYGISQERLIELDKLCKNAPMPCVLTGDFNRLGMVDLDINEADFVYNVTSPVSELDIERPYATADPTNGFKACSIFSALPLLFMRVSQCNKPMKTPGFDEFVKDVSKGLTEMTISDLYGLWGAPWIEEWCKRRVNWFTALLIFQEACAATVSFKAILEQKGVKASWGGVFGATFLFKTIQHVSMVVLPEKYGVALHWWNNFGALCLDTKKWWFVPSTFYFFLTRSLYEAWGWDWPLAQLL